MVRAYCWDDMRRMRWTRRNRVRLTEWRRELIPQVRWCICVDVICVGGAVIVRRAGWIHAISRWLESRHE